jgi:hypothetical protein
VPPARLERATNGLAGALLYPVELRGRIDICSTTTALLARSLHKIEANGAFYLVAAGRKAAATEFIISCGTSGLLSQAGDVLLNHRLKHLPVVRVQTLRHRDLRGGFSRDWN